MPFNGTLQFGDVVLVPFPFINQQATKQSPVVVVSTPAYASARPDVVLMAITSQVRTPLSFGEVLIADWQTARLIKESVVKPLLATLEQVLIIRQLGVLSTGDQAALKKAMVEILG